MSENKVKISTDEVEAFFSRWAIYQKVIKHNHMFHREIFAEVNQLLNQIQTPFSFLDLGCGDASILAPLLIHRPITQYYGVDLSAPALELAADHLKPLQDRVRLQQADLLNVIQQSSETYQVIFSSYALHHLSLDQKRQFFAAAAKRLSPNGQLIIIDIFREEHQSLAAYLKDYCQWAFKEWHGLSTEEQQQSCTHITEYDLPETLSTFENIATESGFSNMQVICHYLWHHLLYFRV